MAFASAENTDVPSGSLRDIVCLFIIAAEVTLAPSLEPSEVYSELCLYLLWYQLHQEGARCKRTLVAKSGFPLSLSEWSFTVCPTPHNY